MKHEYDQNLATCTFWPTSARLHANFLFIVYFEAKGTCWTPQIWSTTSYLICLLKCFLHLTTNYHMTVFYFKQHCVCTLLPWAVEQSIIHFLQEAAYYSKYSRIFGPGLRVALGNSSPMPSLTSYYSLSLEPSYVQRTIARASDVRASNHRSCIWARRLGPGAVT